MSRHTVHRTRYPRRTRRGPVPLRDAVGEPGPRMPQVRRHSALPEGETGCTHRRTASGGKVRPAGPGGIGAPTERTEGAGLWGGPGMSVAARPGDGPAAADGGNRTAADRRCGGKGGGTRACWLASRRARPWGTARTDHSYGADPRAEAHEVRGLPRLVGHEVRGPVRTGGQDVRAGGTWGGADRSGHPAPARAGHDRGIVAAGFDDVIRGAIETGRTRRGPVRGPYGYGAPIRARVGAMRVQRLR